MEWSSLESEGGRPSALYIYQVAWLDVLCCVSFFANAVNGEQGGVHKSLPHILPRNNTFFLILKGLDVGGGEEMENFFYLGFFFA